MEIQVDLTRADYADFNKYFFFKRKFKRILFNIIIIPFLITLYVTRNDLNNLFEFCIWYVITVLFFGIIYLGIIMLTLKRTGKLPSDKGSILGKRKYTITDEGLLEESEINNNLRKWSGIKTVDVNRNSVFIVVDTIAAYVIPKRSFKDDNEMNSFVQRVTEKIKNAT